MLIALSGPSGIGKGFIKETALKRYPMLTELQWLTTRPLRDGEGRRGNRVSISPTRFDSLVSRELCALVQELHGNRYALLRSHLLDASRPRLTEIHPGNAQEAVQLRPDVFLIGLTTDDLSLLGERLSKRGEAGANERLLAAQAEMALLAKVRHFYHAVFSVSRETVDVVREEVLRTICKLFDSVNTQGEE